MIVRQPLIDFGSVRPHWSPNPEFAQHHNASSTTPVYVEPYLIKVMNKAKALIDPSDHATLSAIDTFNKQEGQHFRQHAAFNEALYRAGYSQLPSLEQGLKQDLLEMLNKRSLKFNMAYSEGFEAMGPAAAAVWFEESDEFLDGADPQVVDLWKWHMAEEFEHRQVCFDLFHKLYSRGPITAVLNGWFYRVYGFIYAIIHLGGYIDKVSGYLIEKDRETMSVEELAASKLRQKAVKAAIRRTMHPRLLLVLSPFYNPGRKHMPKGLTEFLHRFEPGGDRAAAI